MTPDMTVNLAGIPLRNPVMTASGTFGYGEEFAEYVDLESIGAFVTKGLSLKAEGRQPDSAHCRDPRRDAERHRPAERGHRCLHRQKGTLSADVSTPRLSPTSSAIPIDEYAEMARRLDEIPEVAGLEVNISCPNVKQGGIVFGTDPACAFDVVSACRMVTIKPLIVKLSPNVTDVVAMAQACEDAGADALSLINTLTGMAIDLNRRRPVLANITGGFSGPAIKPIALRMVWQVARAVNLPIIGIGGIMNATDALEFILAGATAVQVGTASFINPGAAQQIARDMEAWLIANGVADIKSLIGALEV